MPRVLTDDRTARPSGGSNANGMTRGSHGPSDSGTQSGVGVSQALGLAGLIVLAEYLARRILAPTLPSIGASPVNSESLPIGAPVVNDMLATALIYRGCEWASATPQESDALQVRLPAMSDAHDRRAGTEVRHVR